jgi:signal peptidase I
MTSLYINRASNPVTVLPPEQAKSPSRVGRALLAGFLSLLVSGLGQLLNRQPRKAFIFAVLSAVFPLLVFRSRILTVYSGLLAALAVNLAWKIFMVADAIYVAASAKRSEPPLRAPRALYPILGVLIVGLAVVPSYTDLKKASGLEAFKISSDSMCPTICTGDRLISDSRAFHSDPPQRGDLVVFLFRPGVTYTKRIIGIAGDVVSPGPDGTILVNGHEFRPPPPCGGPDSTTPSKLELRTDFMSTVVPANSFFVVGDNLNASFDSRVPGFGPVTTETLRGKPLFIWWSPAKARRGCHLQ